MKVTKETKLGTIVKDKTTGFIGKLTARQERIGGYYICQVTHVLKWESHQLTEYRFDMVNLIVVPPKKPKPKLKYKPKLKSKPKPKEEDRFCHIPNVQHNLL